MALRRIYKTYYVYFRDIDGTQRTRSLKTHDRTTAERLHRQFMSLLEAKKGELMIMNNFPERFPQAAEVKTVAPPVIEPPANQRFRLDRMLSELDLIKAPSGTDRRIITRFIEKVGKKYADEVTPQVALAYLEKHYTGGRNFKNFNNNRCALNKAFKLLLVKMHLDKSPFEPIACRSVDNVESHRPITPEEFRRIFKEAEEPFRTAACLGFYAGADMSTAFGLPCNAVNLETRIINWRRPKSGVRFVCGIHKELLAMLQKINFDPESSSPLLSCIAKTCSTTRNVYFRELFDRLGIKGNSDGSASFHSFRSSFFTRCDEAKLHRRTTSLAGGHTQDIMNDLYSHDVSAAHEVETLADVGILDM
ncbi:MAG: hypothetical protein IJY46_07590 [Lentisphaeria bacterium]|nr:hypothetical protein [Lentisphaeria bacterium]